LIGNKTLLTKWNCTIQKDLCFSQNNATHVAGITQSYLPHTPVILYSYTTTRQHPTPFFDCYQTTPQDHRLKAQPFCSLNYSPTELWAQLHVMNAYKGTNNTKVTIKKLSQTPQNKNSPYQSNSNNWQWPYNNHKPVKNLWYINS
jgi:hypothetical protein